MLIALNKFYDVLCQFTDPQGRATLADYVSVPGVHAAGRLDRDSEGLLLLSDEGPADPAHQSPAARTGQVYWAQVEGVPMQALSNWRGVLLGRWNDSTGTSAPAGCRAAGLCGRVIHRSAIERIPTAWMEL